MSTVLSNQKRLAQAFLEKEATWEGDAIFALRTPGCPYEILPKSLGQPIRSHDETKKFYAGFKPLWSNYKNDLLQAVHDGEAHKSVLHIWNSVETPVGPFSVESVFILTFTTDGTKICKVEEMLDPEYMNAFFAKLPKSIVKGS